MLHYSPLQHACVTAQAFRAVQLRDLANEVSPQRNLIVCCGAFRGDDSQIDNLMATKGPNIVRKESERGHNDYSLNVTNPPAALARRRQSGFFDTRED